MGEFAFLLFFLFSKICMTFLSVSAVGSPKLGWNFCFTQSRLAVPHEVKSLLLSSFHSLSSRSQGYLGIELIAKQLIRKMNAMFRNAVLHVQILFLETC